MTLALSVIVEEFKNIQVGSIILERVMDAQGAKTSYCAIFSLVITVGGWAYQLLIGDHDLTILFVSSVVAMILGHIAIGEIKRNPERVTGNGIVIVSLCLSWSTALGISALFLVYKGFYWILSGFSGPGFSGR